MSFKISLLFPRVGEGTDHFFTYFAPTVCCNAHPVVLAESPWCECFHKPLGNYLRGVVLCKICRLMASTLKILILVHEVYSETHVWFGRATRPHISDGREVLGISELLLQLYPTLCIELKDRCLGKVLSLRQSVFRIYNCHQLLEALFSTVFICIISLQYNTICNCACNVLVLLSILFIRGNGWKSSWNCWLSNRRFARRSSWAALLAT